MPAIPSIFVFLVLGTAVPSARCQVGVKIHRSAEFFIPKFDEVMPEAIAAYKGPIPNIRMIPNIKNELAQFELAKSDLPNILNLRSAQFELPKLDSVKIPDISVPKMPELAKFDTPNIVLPRTCGQCSPDNLPSYHTQADIEADATLQTVELIQKYGFPVETHFVYTADGYRLCLHRVPRPGATPVLLVHGLMASSAAWVQLGPQYGLAYILYLKGYDVWMLNTRGNIYSRDHLKGRLPDSQYWDFSFHEIGVYDLPAAVDLVLQKTLKPQLQYIGHSQGSTVFFVMCSERPEYAAKVTLMQSLSPTVFLQGNRSPVLKFLGLFRGGFTVLLSLLGGHEISLKTTLIHQFRQHICSSSNLASRICALFDYVLCGFDWRGFNETLAPIIEGHSSQGCSAKQVHHYAQQQGQLLFQRYDHGRILNRIRYKSFSPPQYNLSQALSKVVLYRGGGDWLGSDFDAGQLQQRLPNCIENRKVQFESFSHFDFTISKDVRPLVYDQVIAQCGSN